MKNEEVAALLKDAQHFWMKWRDNVPNADSDTWDVITGEACEIINRYGSRKVKKNQDGSVIAVEEKLAEPIIFFFLDLLRERY